MNIRNKVLVIFAILFCIVFNANNFSIAQEQKTEEAKYPDYAQEFIGDDKYENFNRKMYTFNSKLNKYVIKPVHVTWASIMPKYGMDRIQSAYNNIEYPKRLASCLIQKDFKASGRETLRFLTNTTIGLGGMYDPAKKYFDLEPAKENMEQALCKCKVKSGPYMVLPVVTSTTPREIAGKALECPLDPCFYIASPVVAIVKSGLIMNRTSYLQPLSKMVESTYADPYDITKKLYGMENYIKNSNLDRKEVLNTELDVVGDILAQRVLNMGDNSELSSETATVGEFVIAERELQEDSYLQNGEYTNTEDGITDAILAELQLPQEFFEYGFEQEKVAINGTISQEELLGITEDESVKAQLEADIIFSDYNSQTPVLDSLRTALFDIPEVNKSIWSEMSVWNRCFSKKIKTSSVSIDPGRENYKYKYIMQKDKNSPVAIIYPSIGEGITSHHSIILAKIFYDEGYSVVIQGSHFHWEFVKSMPETYRPGIPTQDAHYLRLVTSEILNSLQKKYDCQFDEKVVLGTSLGGMAALFVADSESKENKLGNTKFISVCPPVELMYALGQLDKNSEEWKKTTSDFKHKTALTAAKIVHLSQMKNEPDFELDALPFTEDEAKLIVGFIMHQKLSDLIFTIENAPTSRKSEIYKLISNMGYRDYAQKYLINEQMDSFEDLFLATTLHSIAGYLKNNNNYKIYHTLDDYFVNPKQLIQLKEYSGDNIVMLSNGSHLGFLYRQEFISELKKDISLGEKIATGLKK